MTTITKDITYIGVNDHKTDLFEGLYPIPDGMAYNSYVIQDEKIAVLDTTDGGFEEEWFQNLTNTIGQKEVDYLIIHHMECDHSSGIALFLEHSPNATLVGTQGAFNMLKQLVPLKENQPMLVVKDGEELSLGTHQLKFVTAPFVHWPEVMMTYDQSDKVLFSADAFGKFGALDKTEEDWACEARRYYFGIVGKFGAQVQTLLAKLKDVDIQTICPLHGPVLKEGLGYYLDLYNKWSSYTPEEEGIVLVYTTVYGHMKEAVYYLQSVLESKGAKVSVFDATRDMQSEIVEDCFKYGKIVFATTTYNSGFFPTMRYLLDVLVEHNFQKRTVGFIESGMWGPMAKKHMMAQLESCKELTFLETSVTLKPCLTEELKVELEKIADELLAK